MVRLAVVGDVHGQWSPADAACLRLLAPDAVLWVGDIGNEDVSLVQQIAALDDLEKAVILGNHDAWYTMTARGRQRASSRHSSPARTTSPTLSAGGEPQQQQVGQQQDGQQAYSDGVQQQLDALGANHVGYGHKALPGTNISIVGARPFSKGGKDFGSIASFMSRFGVCDMQQSADKVVEVIQNQVPPGNTLVLMAHNGPSGLGAERHHICGCDWLSEAGDHGDPDLQLALQQLQQAGRRVALLLHGHMHHMIKGGGWRQMVCVDPESGTLCLNAATVPRVVPLPHSNGTAAASRHHFLLVDLLDGVPCCAADVWVQTAHQSDTNTTNTSQDAAIAAQQGSFLASTAAAMHSVQHSKSKTKTAKAAAAKATQDEALRRLKLQAPQQLQLSHTQGVFEGFQVHVAEVYEVLRTVQPFDGDTAAAADGDASTVAAAVASNGCSGRASSQDAAVWQYFDAHLGKWIAASQPLCTTSSSGSSAAEAGEACAGVPLPDSCTAALSS